MLWLKRVIARLLGQQTPPLGNPVLPTPTAGPVGPEPIAPTGSKPSVEEAIHLHPLPLPPARPRSRKKPKPVQSTTQASSGTSKKQKAAQTGKSPTSDGNSTQTPARRTRRHAK
jgi:hypothetical protein